MESLITQSNVMFVVWGITVIFGIYFYFRNPQEALDKKQALDNQDVEAKAEVLAKQLQWERDSNEKRFAEIGIRTDKALTMAQNHIHSVDLKVDKVTESVSLLTLQVTKLGTIIEERIPKK